MERKFVRVASTYDVPPGTGRMVMAQGKPIALFNVEGSFLCHQPNLCTQGRIAFRATSGGEGWSYLVDTGLPDHDGGHAVAAYEVKVEGDDVFVGWLKT